MALQGTAEDRTSSIQTEMPVEARIQPVPCLSTEEEAGKKMQVQQQVPSDSVEQMLEPKLILERRMVNREGKAVTEVLGAGEEVSWIRPWGNVDLKEGALMQVPFRSRYSGFFTDYRKLLSLYNNFRKSSWLKSLEAWREEI